MLKKEVVSKIKLKKLINMQQPLSLTTVAQLVGEMCIPISLGQCFQT